MFGSAILQNQNSNLLTSNDIILIRYFNNLKTIIVIILSHYNDIGRGLTGHGVSQSEAADLFDLEMFDSSS